MNIRFVSLLSFLVLLLTLPASVYAQSGGRRRIVPGPSAVNWITVNRELNQTLLTQDIGVLAQAALKDPPPKTPKEWLYRLALLTRADYRTETLTYLNVRPAYMDPQTEWYLNWAVGEAGGTDNIPLAKRLSELFPETAYIVPWFGEWTKTVPAKEADEWLAKQGHQGNEVWFYERLRLRGKLGTERELLVPLEQAVREHPGDEETLRQYLAAVNATKKPQPTDWLIAVLKPRLAAQSYLMAKSVPLPANVKQALYERSLTQRFTPEDEAWFVRYERQYPPAYGPRARNLSEKDLRTWTRQALLLLYRENNQPEKARQIQKELTKKNATGTDGTKIGTEKPEYQESGEYWLKQAQDYSDLNKEILADEAFEKALTRSPLPPSGIYSPRFLVVQAYARHLGKRDRYGEKDAYNFLRAQLALSSNQDGMADRIVEEMVTYSRSKRQSVAYDDPLLWGYLEALPAWHYGAMRLLEHLIEVAPKEKRPAQWTRAERLLKGDALPQRFILAQAVANTSGWSDAIGIYLDLLERANGDKDVRLQALKGLLQAYRQTKDFQGLKRIYPELLAGGEWDGEPVRAFYELAAAAGRAGDKVEALRFFKAGKNQDRRSIPQRHHLQYMGIENEARAFYREIEQKEPHCDAPRRFWKMLGGS